MMSFEMSQAGTKEMMAPLWGGRGLREIKMN